MGKDFIIRKAKKEDCPVIYQFQQEHADFEDATLKIRVKDLEEDGFGEDQWYHCLIAECQRDGSIVGVLTYCHAYSSWEGRCCYIDDLFVPHRNRRRGIGAALFRETVKIAHEKRCKRLELICNEKNAGAHKFYNMQGTENVTKADDWHVVRLTADAIANIAQD